MTSATALHLQAMHWTDHGPIGMARRAGSDYRSALPWLLDGLKLYTRRRRGTGLNARRRRAVEASEEGCCRGRLRRRNHAVTRTRIDGDPLRGRNGPAT